MTEIEEAFQLAKEQWNLANERYRTAGKAMFGEAARDLFRTYPPVASIEWQQYTPYFQDGDECHFGVRHYDYGIEYKDGQDDRDYSKDMENDITTFLRRFDDSLLKDIFGDHVAISISWDGTVTTREYEHE